jgi:hypothetical protein
MASPSRRPSAAASSVEGNIPGLLSTPSDVNVGKDVLAAGTLPAEYLVPGLRLADLRSPYLGNLVLVTCPMCVVMVDRLAENLARCDVVRDPPLNGAEDEVPRPWIEPYRLVTWLLVPRPMEERRGVPLAALRRIPPPAEAALRDNPPAPPPRPALTYEP